MITEDTLRAGLEQYLAPILEEYRRRLPTYTQPKIMRDAIWGFNLFEPYELALIDSPVFQRLRNIFQTSLALFTYPCAVHSRFEHSLGAASVASRMLSALVERLGQRRLPRAHSVMKIETRLGILLHDLGHGPLSHSSEKFYEQLVDHTGDPIFIKEHPRSLPSQRHIFSEASASEILTYLMITTKSFQDFWSHIVERYRSVNSDLGSVDLERVARMILGVDDGIGNDVRFYRQIVNGPFDADKLDYLPRDGYFTGLEIIVDIERLFHTITVITKDGISDLGIVISGSSVLEQVIFSKAQLYASMYHHHKVRAAHQLFLRLLHTMLERNYKPAGLDLHDPTSYVRLDDYDILHSRHGDSDIDLIVNMLKARMLPKRALVIAYPCFDEDDMTSRSNFFDKLDGTDLSRIEQDIEREARLPRGSVIFDRPDPPRLSGTAQSVVQITDDQTVVLEDLYPAGAWANAFLGYRRMGYVFTTAENSRRVGNAARDILAQQRYPVRLNQNSLSLAKHS